MSGHLSDIAHYNRWYNGTDKRWERAPFPRIRLFGKVRRNA